MRRLLLVLVVITLTGCGDSGLDPTPEKKSGAASREFEKQDLERARNADRLVELYCEGVESEAQRLGCLSHVTPSDVCEQDTAAKEEAVAAYIDETSDRTICD